MTERRVCSCGKEISQERLTALPDTQTCITCSTETKYVGNVFGTVRHKGFEVEVVKNWNEDTRNSVPRRRRPKDNVREVRRERSGDDLPKQGNLPIMSPSSQVETPPKVNETTCFVCKRKHPSLEPYKPFPGVMCPRDRRRARAGKFLLRKLLSQSSAV